MNVKQAIRWIASFPVQILLWLFHSRPSHKLRRLFEDNKLSNDLRRLRNRGIDLKTVYDIGANEGSWTAFFSSQLPRSKFFLFEANQAHAPALEKTGYPHFIALLSSSEKTVSFYQADSTGDSYYKENTARYADVTPTERQTTTLDKLVRQNDLPLPDLIKIDTQGSELDIFEGGRETLAHAALVYMECPTVAYNEAAPHIQDYLSGMQAHGFIPFNVYEIHRKAEVLVQLDILFVRKDILFGLFPKAAATYTAL